MLKTVKVGLLYYQRELTGFNFVGERKTGSRHCRMIDVTLEVFG